MENNNFAKIWSPTSDALYDTKKTIKILEAFNSAIDSLYYLGGEEEYISRVLNTTTYVEAECSRLNKSMGIELSDISNKLEMIRSLLFGDCFDWNYICNTLKDIPKNDENADITLLSNL